jgi:GT2 family glycosyltransferase/lipopolysaccharide/colanic/teichoic acid biosynthesis glycosyltransferase
MDLSVIVVSFNSAGFIERCLASVETCLRAVNHEICVVDNASSDGSARLVRERFPRVTVIENLENLGFAAGVNRGLDATRGCYVLWLNPDAELLDGGVGDLIDYFEKHPRVGIIGPQLLDPSGEVQLSCRSFPSLRTALFHRYSLLTRWFPKNPGSSEYLLSDWDHGTAREVDWVSGACLLHRRHLLDAIGPLDEGFFMYCEDVDFCLRARQAGWRVHYHPGMQVLHHIGGSSRPDAVPLVVARHRSMWRYYAKHFRRHPLKDAVVAGVVWARCGLAAARVSWRRRRAARGPRDGGAGRSTLASKRAFDVVLAGTGLLASLPLWGLIAVLIKLDDGGPVFYGQERVGRDGRRFWSWKFRSMLPDGDGPKDLLPTAADDARITRAGRLLRATAMDELPQLWNIFLGDMSFVGPRALAPAEVEVGGTGPAVPLEKIRGYEARHRVRPGLTGIAQIYASRDLPRRQKFRLDLLYVRKQSFWLDLGLVALSFWISFRGRWEHRGRKV